jgi:uncharacterized protein YigA (DUF484 family)
VDEDDIRDFLVENPDYFQRHPDLLSLLQVPHSSGAAVSLVERQVSVLRERNVDLRHRLRELGSTAKENDQLFAATRELVLALLDADGLSALNGALLRVLRDDFDTEYAALLLFSDTPDQDNPWRIIPEADARGRLGALIGSRDAGCGALRAEEFGYLFGGVRLVGSAAVAVIRSGESAVGLLAVGSSDAGRYDGSTGTLFLEFAAEVMGRRLAELGFDG